MLVIIIGFGNFYWLVIMIGIGDFYLLVIMIGIGDFYRLVIMIGIGDFYWLTAVSLVGSDRVSSLRGTTGLPGTRPTPDADVAKNQQKSQPGKISQ